MSMYVNKNMKRQLINNRQFIPNVFKALLKFNKCGNSEC